MALSASTIFEVQTGGDDTNGGGFVEGASGTDYSLVAGKRTAGDVTDISVTDGVTAGTTTVTSATANFGTTIVGNIIYIQGGTGSVAANWYQVTARASTTSITVDRSTGLTAGTGVTINIGGCLASPGGAGATPLVTGNTVWIKAGTYTVTSASSNVSNGCYSSALGIRLEGYQTTRGDLGTPPLIQASGIDTFTLISATNDAGNMTNNLRVDGAGLTSSRGFVLRSLSYKLTAENCTNNGFTLSSSAPLLIHCIATGCSTQPAFNDVNCLGCIADSNTITGFTASAGRILSNCISSNNSGASSDGFTTSNSNNTFKNCVAYNNGRDGFRAAFRQQVCINCIAEDNAGGGFLVNNVASVRLQNCAVYSNGTDFSLGTGKFVLNIDSVTGTSSFFTNAAADDFTLNNTAGGGAEARGAGYPGTLPA